LGGFPDRLAQSRRRPQRPRQLAVCRGAAL